MHRQIGNTRAEEQPGKLESGAAPELRDGAPATTKSAEKKGRSPIDTFRARPLANRAASLTVKRRLTPCCSQVVCHFV